MRSGRGRSSCLFGAPVSGHIVAAKATRQNLGSEILERVKKDLEEVGMIEQFPRLEGKQMVMIIGPKKK